MEELPTAAEVGEPDAAEDSAGGVAAEEVAKAVGAEESDGEVAVEELAEGVAAEDSATEDPAGVPAGSVAVDAEDPAGSDDSATDEAG